MKPLISGRGHSTMVSAISAMKRDAQHESGPAGAGDADRVAGAVGAADAHGAGLADPHAAP